MYTQKEALNIISKTAIGKDRAKILKNDDFRKLVLSTGANVTLYTCKIDENEQNPAKMLKNVYVGLILRKNKKGKFDGLGALGGLAERTNKDEFDKMSLEEKIKLVGNKDDVIMIGEVPSLIFDIDIIRKNNVLREMKEELSNLGIYDVCIDTSVLELVPMPKVKDDNYMINIWDGEGECFAISPYCHTYEDKKGLIDDICSRAKEQIGGEVFEYKKIPLVEALCAYGNRGDMGYCLEDGRDALNDYRYPHEYLVCWALAAKLLNYNEEKMVELAIRVQKKSNHLISFENIANATSQSIEDVATIVKVGESVLKKMERNMKSVYENNRRCSLVKIKDFDR